MSKKLHQIFKNITSIEPSFRLKSAIFRKIELERKKQIRQGLALRRVWSFGSLGLTAYAIFAFGNSILKSDFWSILALAFSDLKIVTTYWNDYLYSIMETLPVLNMLGILIPVFLFILSLNFYFNFKHKNSFRRYNYA